MNPKMRRLTNRRKHGFTLNVKQGATPLLQIPREGMTGIVFRTLARLRVGIQVHPGGTF